MRTGSKIQWELKRKVALSGYAHKEYNQHRDPMGSTSMFSVFVYYLFLGDVYFCHSFLLQQH